jgi:hypothetical protein
MEPNNICMFSVNIAVPLFFTFLLMILQIAYNKLNTKM